MYHPAIARLEVHRPEPADGGEARRQHEDAELVVPRGLQLVRLAHRQDQVRLAQRPVRGEYLRRESILGSPSGQPASSHSRSVATSASASTRSSRNGPPYGGVAGQGGITFSPVTSTMSAARLRACSYVSGANGAAWPGRWHS